MKDKDRIALQKMDKYICIILSYTKDMEFEHFVNDDKTLNASAFLVGQIGELSIHVSEDVKAENPQIPWQSMRGIRNRIIHDYENIDVAVLWATITKSLPELSKLIKASIAKASAAFDIENDNHSSYL